MAEQTHKMIVFQMSWGSYQGRDVVPVPKEKADHLCRRKVKGTYVARLARPDEIKKDLPQYGIFKPEPEELVEETEDAEKGDEKGDEKDDTSKKLLVARAKKLGIQYASNMNKDTLLAEIEKAQKGPEDPIEE